MDNLLYFKNQLISIYIHYIVMNSTFVEVQQYTFLYNILLSRSRLLPHCFPSLRFYKMLLQGQIIMRVGLYLLLLGFLPCQQVFFCKEVSCDLLLGNFCRSQNCIMSNSLRSLTKMSDHERITQVAHQQWENERIAHFFKRIAHSLIFSQKTERFAQKTDERIPSPATCPDWES